MIRRIFYIRYKGKGTEVAMKIFKRLGPKMTVKSVLRWTGRIPEDPEPTQRAAGSQGMVRVGETFFPSEKHSN